MFAVYECMVVLTKEHKHGRVLLFLTKMVSNELWSLHQMGVASFVGFSSSCTNCSPVSSVGFQSLTKRG